jgi:hypothetical protein
LLLLGFANEAFSRIIYIRNRHGGCLFGYKYVTSTVHSGPEVGDLTFITNCYDAGLNRCRHNRISSSEPTELQFDAIDNAITQSMNNGLTQGTFLYANEWVVVWKDVYISSTKQYQMTVTIYTLAEANAYGIIY